MVRRSILSVHLSLACPCPSIQQPSDLGGCARKVDIHHLQVAFITSVTTIGLQGRTSLSIQRGASCLDMKACGLRREITHPGYARGRNNLKRISPVLGTSAR